MNASSMVGSSAPVSACACFLRASGAPLAIWRGAIESVTGRNIRLVHEMGRDQNRHTAPDKAIDMRPEFPPHDRIDARGRFVEEQDRRLMQHRAGQGEALLEAERQRAGIALQMRAKLENLRRIFDRRLGLST